MRHGSGGLLNHGVMGSLELGETFKSSLRWKISTLNSIVLQAVIISVQYKTNHSSARFFVVYNQGRPKHVRPDTVAGYPPCASNPSLVYHITQSQKPTLHISQTRPHPLKSCRRSQVFLGTLK